MPKKLEAYTEGTVTLFHAELDVTMDVPEDTVENWEQAGWKKASAKVAKAAEKEDE